MSGGHFQYKQYEFGYIADEIEQLILDNGSEELDEWGYKLHCNFPKEIIDEFRNAVALLRLTQVYVQRIDWLVSGDDGEDSFISRLKYETEKLKNEHILS